MKELNTSMPIAAQEPLDPEVSEPKPDGNTQLDRHSSTALRRTSTKRKRQEITEEGIFMSFMYTGMII